MFCASNHAMRHIKRSKAAPGMSTDEQAQPIQTIIASGRVTHITSADVIAHHDEVNRCHRLGGVAARPN